MWEKWKKKKNKIKNNLKYFTQQETKAAKCNFALKSFLRAGYSSSHWFCLKIHHDKTVRGQHSGLLLNHYKRKKNRALVIAVTATLCFSLSICTCTSYSAHGDIPSGNFLEFGTVVWFVSVQLRWPHKHVFGHKMGTSSELIRLPWCIFTQMSYRTKWWSRDI